MASIIELIAGVVGPKAARPVFWIIIVLLVIGLLGLAKCVMDHSSDSQVTAQASQTVASGQAMSDSAQNAVAQVINQSEAQRNAEQVASDAARVMDQKPASPEAYRAAKSAVCQLPEFQEDPSCK